MTAPPIGADSLSPEPRRHPHSKPYVAGFDADGYGAVVRLAVPRSADDAEEGSIARGGDNGI